MNNLTHRTFQEEQAIAYQLGPQENGYAMIEIFKAALSAYITSAGVRADPVAAVAFARSVIRATMNQDPSAIGPDLVGQVTKQP